MRLPQSLKINFPECRGGVYQILCVAADGPTNRRPPSNHTTDLESLYGVKKYSETQGLVVISHQEPTELRAASVPGGYSATVVLDNRS